MEKSEIHFGVYGVVLSADETEILVVEKRRGPYKGYYDLPGGQPEPGETEDETLARELLEETGGSIHTVSDEWHEFDLMVTKDSTGNDIRFRHKGKWRYVVLTDVDLSVRDIEDVSTVAWKDVKALTLSGYVSAPLLQFLHVRMRSDP